MSFHRGILLIITVLSKLHTLWLRFEFCVNFTSSFPFSDSIIFASGDVGMTTTTSDTPIDKGRKEERDHFLFFNYILILV